MTQFSFQRMQRTNKQKINKEFVYELQDIPEGEVEDTTEGKMLTLRMMLLCRLKRVLELLLVTLQILEIQ